MSDLNLKLPDSATTPPKPSGDSALFKLLLVILLIACLASIWLLPAKKETPLATIPAGPQKSLAIGSHETLILKLKKAGAYNEAAEIMEYMIHNDKIDKERKATLLKKQGELYALGENFDKALKSFYLSEDFNQGKNAELERETTTAIIELLRKKGNYNAVSSHVAEKNRSRKGEKASAQDPVVARVDGVDIHMSQFESDLQKFVDQQVHVLTANIKDPIEKAKIEDDTRKQYAAPYEKLKYLQRWIGEEVLYREALEWKLDKHPKYTETLENVRKQILRNLLIEDKTRVGEVSELDLKNYIETHREDLGLSTDPGTLSPDDIAGVKEQAESQYRQEKSKELAQAFQADVQKRHQVEIIKEAFSEKHN